MAETILSSASERQVWITKYFQEYVRNSRFMPYMSNSDINKGGIILTKFQAEEEAKRTINIPFIGRLKSALGVTGAAVLDGQEEDLVNYNCPITIDWRRNGAPPQVDHLPHRDQPVGRRQGRPAGVGVGEAARRHHPCDVRGGH